MKCLATRIMTGVETKMKGKELLPMYLNMVMH